MSIVVRNMTKIYALSSGRHKVLDDISLEVRRGEKWGILGKNGAGKSTFIRLVSGAEIPTSGTVERNMSVSWPLGLTSGFQGSLTGLDNIRFVCRIYGVDFRAAIDRVEDFAELGAFLKEPVKYFSSGMVSRLAFGLSIAIEFDCFLVDEGFSVGDYRFMRKSEREIFEKRADRAMVIVSHDASFIDKYCDRIAVLQSGHLSIFLDKKEAFEVYLNTPD